MDRRRPKKGSNKDWAHPHDPDARITQMKDGRTHLAHKAEHVMDMETGAIVAVTVQPADQGDTTTIETTLPEAAATDRPVKTGEELVADKGFHAERVLLDLVLMCWRTYISEPDRAPQCWVDEHDARDAVYGNRRRIRGARGKALLQRRGELLERPNQHLYDRGGMRRTHLRGHENILKRLLVHAGGANLGLWMRTLIGIGTPRGLQGRAIPVFDVLMAIWRAVRPLVVTIWARPTSHDESTRLWFDRGPRDRLVRNGTCTTGC